MDTNPISTNPPDRKTLSSRRRRSGVEGIACAPGPPLRHRAASIVPVTAVCILTLLSNIAIAQTTTTVTHHRVKESNSSPQLAEAETAIEKRDYATAEPLLEKVTQASPENYEAWFDLGFVFHALGKIDDSIAAYRKSVAANPAIFESNLNLGLTLAQSQSPEAEQFLRAATTLKPTAHVEEGQAHAWLALAHLLETTKPDGALEAYRRAATLQPRDAEPHLSAGLLLERQNRFDEAAQEYKLGVAVTPLSADAFTALANAYVRGQHYAQAEETLRTWTAPHPEDGPMRIQLGRVLAAEGKNEDAIVELESGLKSTPNNSEGQRDLADLYMTAGKNDQALGAYKSILQQSPNDAEVHDQVGKILLRQHRFRQAEQEFMAAVKLKPDFGAGYGDLAAAANENKDYVLVIKAADTRAKFLPEIPISFFLRATAYDHLHDIKNAGLNYHKFIDADAGKLPDQEWQARQRLLALERRK